MGKCLILIEQQQDEENLKKRQSMSTCKLMLLYSGEYRQASDTNTIRKQTPFLSCDLHGSFHVHTLNHIHIVVVAE